MTYCIHESTLVHEQAGFLSPEEKEDGVQHWNVSTWIHHVKVVPMAKGALIGPNMPLLFWFGWYFGEEYRTFFELGQVLQMFAGVDKALLMI